MGNVFYFDTFRNMRGGENMEELKGKVIKKIELGEGETEVVFTDDGDMKYFFHANSDCCSSTWFCHITGVKNLLGQKVNMIVKREDFTDEEQKKAEAEGDYESLELYGYDIQTDKGIFFIEFRNDSNGYYGGSCDFSGNTGKTEGFREIVTDF